MARKPSSRQRKNARLADLRSGGTTLPNGIARQPRVPLAGFEALYETTRSGHVYSLRNERFIKHGYLHGPYIRLDVNGESVSLPIPEAVGRSWDQAAGHLFVVEVPATTVVVYAHDEREAQEVAADASREELRDGMRVAATVPLSDADSIPAGWHDALPFRLEDLDSGEQTVADLIRSETARLPDAG